MKIMIALPVFKVNQQKNNDIPWQITKNKCKQKSREYGVLDSKYL